MGTLGTYLHALDITAPEVGDRLYLALDDAWLSKAPDCASLLELYRDGYRLVEARCVDLELAPRRALRWDEPVWVQVVVNRGTELISVRAGDLISSL